MTVLRPHPANDQVGAMLPRIEAVDGLPIEMLPAVLIHLTAMQARIAARLATVPIPASPTVDSPADDWLTPKEVAAYRKVPVSWVRENARRGKLRSHKLGHYVRFRRSELDEDLRTLERQLADH